MPNSPNRTVLARLVERVFSEGDPQELEEIVAADVRLARGHGIAGMRETVTRLRRAFPDLTMAVREVIEDDERIVGRANVTGTHQDDFLGVAPTGRRIELEEILILRIRAGRIVEFANSVDRLALLEQLGAVAGRPGER